MAILKIGIVLIPTDPDTGSTFYFYVDTDPDPTPSFTHVGKSDFLKFFYLQQYLSHSVICVIIFIILDSILKFS
jgi:hypothetical protein